MGPVKPELGVTPLGQENHSGAEDLKKSCYIFVRVFGLHQKLKNRMEINL